jgi:hypothetical protein
MLRFERGSSRLFVCLAGVACVLTGDAFAQERVNAPARHVRFDSPEGWALKYFTSATLLSGLQPPETEDREAPRRFGSVTLGVELGWLPELSAERARVGFSGRKGEELNKVPLLVRPSLRVALPGRFSVVAAGPPPFRMFGVTPRLLTLGVERPLLERDQWRLGWRAYGQTGWVRGAFTCPEKALATPAGSPDNPSGCIDESRDVARLRYAGTEVQWAYRIRQMPKLIPHGAVGVNLINSMFEVDASLETGLDRSRLWTRGVTFNGTAGVSYLLTQRLAFTVDVFYTPLWVRRGSNGPRENDGLFNVRALLSYTLN